MVRHGTVGLVEPRCNTVAGGKWNYRFNSAGLVAGYYWQYDSDSAQLLNSTELMSVATATRQGHYKAIAVDEDVSDKTTKQYQEALRDPG